MTQNQTLEEKQEKELDLVREVLSFDVRRRDLDCNERVLLDALAGQDMNLDVVCSAYEHIKHQLVDSPIWIDAVQELRGAHPEWQLSEAVFQLLTNAWGNHLQNMECS